ncbi:MAG: hypothetical protein JW829_00805, partial [Pirellulales bacterium]|nr:hypothetical protein [Pirellulales bacterium]
QFNGAFSPCLKSEFLIEWHAVLYMGLLLTFSIGRIAHSRVMEEINGGSGIEESSSFKVQAAF